MDEDHIIETSHSASIDNFRILILLVLSVDNNEAYI